MQVYSLGEIFNLEYGWSLTDEDRDGVGFPVFGSSGRVGFHSKAHVKGPGIIVGRKGTAGAVTWCDLDFSPIDTAYYVKLKQSNFDQKYLFHLLSSLNLKKLDSSTGVPGLNRNDVYIQKVTVPDLKEQKRIAEILDEVDRQIEAIQIQIDKERGILEGLTYDLYLEYYDHKTTNSIRIGKPKKSWPIRPLHEVAQVERGKFTHRPRNDTRCYGGIYPFIQTGDVGATRGRRTRSFNQTLSTFGRSVSKEFPKNTVAITIAANIGDTCILDIPMCFPDSVVGIQVNPISLIPEFLEPFLRLHKLFFESRAPQSAQKNINLQDLLPLPTLLPSLEEQTRIANTLGQISDGIDELEEKKSKFLSLKQGLLTKLIGGTDAGPQ